MKELEIFKYEEKEVRVIDKDGEPWWVAKDVADILAYSDTEAMTRRLDEDELKSYTDNSSGQGRSMTILNESGLYEAIFNSNKKTAKAFKRWIKKEVLPSIRKTGGYIQTDETMSDADIMAKAFLIAQKTIENKDKLLAQKEEKLIEQQPKVEFADKVMASETDIPIGVMARLLGIGRNKFFSLLRDKGILCKTGRMRNVATQSYINRGYFTVSEKPIDINDFVVLKFTTLVTPKGQDWFVKKLKKGEKLNERKPR